MSVPPKESPWHTVLWSMVTGIPIGLVIAILGMHWAGWLLLWVLRSEVVGLTTFGGYFAVLGLTGMHGLCSDMQPMKHLLQAISVPKWMFKVAGALLGLAIGALCKNAGLYWAGYVLYASWFAFTAWFFYQFQIEIEKATPDMDGKARRDVIILSSLSLVIGVGALGYVWCRVCSCGVPS